MNLLEINREGVTIVAVEVEWKLWKVWIDLPEASRASYQAGMLRASETTKR